VFLCTCGGKNSPELLPSSILATSPTAPDPPSAPPPELPTDPGPVLGVLIGAGDISTCQNNNDEATARVLDRQEGVIFTAGDNVYDDGTSREFADCYAPTWGRHAGRTRPSPGNHDYETASASGYYQFFGANAGAPGVGYYSYDVGAWHVMSLNSNVGASTGSAQYEWLRADLASSKTVCAVAYWHHPVFSSGEHGNSSKMSAIFRLLYENGVEIVVNGHDHDYERFAPQNPDGQADSAGVRQFVVGTGGKGLDPFIRVQPNSEVRDSSSFGVLKLSLRRAGYDWEFIPVAGGGFSDSGSGSCR